MTIATKGSTRPGVPFPRQLNYRSNALFHFRAADALLTHDPVDDVLKAVTGEAPTFSRASVGGLACDVFGDVRQWGQAIPRIKMFDIDGDGYYETSALLMETAAENVCLRSGAIQTGPWANIDVPAVTGNDAIAPDRSVTATKIEDDGGASLEGRDQDITVANDSTTWCVSVFVKKAAAGATVVALRLQLSVGAAREALVLLDPITGDILTGGAEEVDVGVIEYGRYWRLWCTVANDSSGNTTLTPALFPAWRLTGDLGAVASVDAAQGANHFWGAQVENTTFPTSYVATVAAAVTRVVDSLGYTILFAPDLDEFTLYVELARPLWADLADLSATQGLLQVGDTNGRMSIYLDPSGDVLTAQMDTATTDRTATVAIPSGDPIRVTAQFRTVLAGGAVKIGAGAGFSAWSADASALAAWVASQVLVGKYGTSLADAGIIACKVLPGLQTEAQARRAF